MILLKSDDDLKQMRIAGEKLASVMRGVVKLIKPGISTAEIDAVAEKLILEKGALAAFKGYKGYPATACISVNDEIVHGIPDGRILLEGDIVSIDLGLSFNGYFADCAQTLGVGRIGSEEKKLIEVAKKSLAEGIKKAYSGNCLGDISHSIESFVEAKGFSVVRDFVGHGIGKALHEEPEVPNFGKVQSGPVLKNGMVLAIEPMVNMGGWECKISKNGWTALTKDGSCSAHFEHTVAITEKGPKILTI